MKQRREEMLRNEQKRIEKRMKQLNDETGAMGFSEFDQEKKVYALQDNLQKAKLALSAEQMHKAMSRGNPQPYEDKEAELTRQVEQAQAAYEQGQRDFEAWKKRKAEIHEEYEELQAQLKRIRGY